jgi:hypothetical protein
MLIFQRMIAAAGALGALTLLPACASDVTSSQAATSGGGSGGGSGSGSGGASSASASSGADTGSGGAGGGGPTICGGKAGIPCEADAWCEFTPAGSCGNADMLGVCQPKPDGCDDDCPGVCGCDGVLYCNACYAHSKGVDISSDLGGCNEDQGGEVTAASLFTDVPRFVIFKADPVRDVCFRLMVETSIGPGVGIQTTMGWAVESAEVTASADHCKLVNGAPPITMTSVNADKGSGVLEIMSNGLACSVNIHATLYWENPGLPWVPPSEPINSDNVEVAGGCN